MERSHGFVAIGVVFLLCASFQGAVSDVVSVGDHVEIRNSMDQPWQQGKVIEVAPIKVDVNGAMTSPFFIRKIDPVNARRLSSDIHIGDVVKIRNAASQPWQEGTVTQVAPIKVEINTGGTTSPFFIQKVANRGPNSRRLSDSEFQVGDVVEIRNSLDAPWQQATVTQVGPLTVEVDGQQTSPFFIKQAYAASSKVRRLSDDIQIGDVVQIRNALDQPWSQGKVIQLAPIKVEVGSATTSPFFIKKVYAKSPSTRRLSDFEVGDLVNARDNLEERWQQGTVTQVAPLTIDMNGAKSSPIFVEKLADENDKRVGRRLSSIQVGDAVKVRNALDQPWKQGTVTQVAPIKVNVDGAVMSPFFIMKLDDYSNSAAARKLSTFQVGDAVEVRNEQDQDWQQGTVTQAAPLIVDVNGEMTSPMFVRKVATQGFNGADDGETNLGARRLADEHDEEDASEFEVGDVVKLRNTVHGAWMQGTLIHLEPFQVQF